MTPKVSVITNVTIDHQAYCGDTIEEIAHHKAGIIKSKIPVVTAAQDAPLRIIEEVAKEKHARVYAFNKDFGIDSRSAVTGWPNDLRLVLMIPLLQCCLRRWQVSTNLLILRVH